MLDERRVDREHTMAVIIEKIRRMLVDNHIEPIEVNGRPKHIYYIWKKMMRKQASFRYARERDVQLVELTYRGGISRVVVLPAAADGLDAVEARLAGRYQGWMKALDYQLIDLELPRWTVTSRLSSIASNGQ